MPRDKRPTWAQVAIQRAGLKKAMRAMTFATAWAVVEKDLGEEPSVEAYSAWWKQSSRTTYRELAAWRECFPEFSTPTGFFAVAGTADLSARVPVDWKFA